MASMGSKYIHTYICIQTDTTECITLLRICAQGGNDHVANCLLSLCDDALIENQNGCVILQNNGPMKIVNFVHAQTAETRFSFRRL